MPRAKEQTTDTENANLGAPPPEPAEQQAQANEQRNQEAQQAEQNAPQGSAENQVPPPPQSLNLAAPGAALTPAQVVGIDPVDVKMDVEESERREELPNRQTTNEALKSLDPVSGTPSPGITIQDGVGLTGVTQGQRPTDMSGRPAISREDREVFNQIREALTRAKSDDEGDDSKPKELKGKRTPLELGIPGGVVRRLMDAGAPLQFEEVPNGHVFPETGRRYFLK
jgi:hypothetical protein